MDELTEMSTNSFQFGRLRYYYKGQNINKLHLDHLHGIIVSGKHNSKLF